MKIVTRVTALSILMVCFITSATVYLYGKSASFYERRERNDDGFNRIPKETKTGTLPLLTIFTTIKEKGDIPHHQLAFNIVMTNWPSFAPHIRPVVFLNSTNSSLADEVRRAGWDVLQLEGTNSAGTPFLKGMYRAVFDKYESVFYGFANGDILFDDSLIETLFEVRRKLEELSGNVLVMGRRTNVNVNFNDTDLFEDFQRHRLRDLAYRKGSLFRDDAIDYFFFTNEGCSLKWSQLANVVVGRPAYDNYLVAMAIRHGVNVIDATNTVLAVHISEPGQKFHGSLNKDANYNKEVIGKFDYFTGLTSVARLSTMKDSFENVVVAKRRKINLISKLLHTLFNVY